MQGAVAQAARRPRRPPVGKLEGGRRAIRHACRICPTSGRRRWRPPAARAGGLDRLSSLFNSTLNPAIDAGRPAGRSRSTRFALLNEVVANPALYGFVNATGVAARRDAVHCTPGTLVAPNANLTYVFADGVHRRPAVQSSSQAIVSMITGPQQMARAGRGADRRRAGELAHARRPDACRRSTRRAARQARGVGRLRLRRRRLLDRRHQRQRRRQHRRRRRRHEALRQAARRRACSTTPRPRPTTRRRRRLQAARADGHGLRRATAKGRGTSARRWARAASTINDAQHRARPADADEIGRHQGLAVRRAPDRRLLVHGQDWIHGPTRKLTYQEIASGSSREKGSTARR